LPAFNHKNKTMKTKLFQILGVAAIATLGLASCEVDPCNDVTCANGGTCVDGDCVCATGYEGTDCTTLVRAKFLGSKNVNETCSQSTDSYAVVVTAGSTDTEVTISNLYDAGLVVTGTVNANGGITIDNQTFGTGTISGSVTENGGVLTYNFTIAVGGQSDTCTAVSQ
jgi:hypothetical protein